MRLNGLPVLGVSGWSGSGKTTLLEKILPVLRSRGLSVVTAKHDVHGLAVDRPGKDSDRFFRAGSDVMVEGEGELFLRTHPGPQRDTEHALRRLALTHDLVLVEGHKGIPMPRVWLLAEGETAPPDGVTGILGVLRRDEDRAAALLRLIDEWLSRWWKTTPVMGCVLAGGKAGRKRIERTVRLLASACARVVFAGDGAMPETPSRKPWLPGAPGVRGPLAGILAAMRWAPEASWIAADGDQNHLSPRSIDRLLSARTPGVWGILAGPDRPGGPVLAHFDPRSRGILERLATQGSRLTEVLSHPKVLRLPFPTSSMPARRGTGASPARTTA